MKRAAIVAVWIAVFIALLFLARTPLQRLSTVVRLYRTELRAPLTVPVKGARRSALAGSWGAARSGGRTHEGIDIFAKCGHPVVSATEGVVFQVGTNTLGGKVVWVVGPGGTYHYYAHLSRYAAISRWDHVQPGDILGYVGATGNARGTPCHLHYGIYRKGQAQDPYPFLAVAP